MNKIFPIHLRANHSYGYADCPKLAKLIWARHRVAHPNLIWYAVDCIVMGPLAVKVFICEIGDGSWGGIGKAILEFVVQEFTPEEQEALDKVLLDSYHTAAEDAIEMEEAALKMARVVAKRRAMFGV